MSKKRKSRKSHMGSSIDDFLKEEGIFEEAQAQAIDQGGRRVATRRGYEEEKNIQKQDGHAAEDQPHPGGPAPESEKRHHPVQPATSGGDGGTASDDRAGLIKRDPRPSYQKPEPGCDQAAFEPEGLLSLRASIRTILSSLISLSLLRIASTRFCSVFEKYKITLIDFDASLAFSYVFV